MRTSPGRVARAPAPAVARASAPPMWRNWSIVRVFPAPGAGYSRWPRIVVDRARRECLEQLVAHVERQRVERVHGEVGQDDWRDRCATLSRQSSWPTSPWTRSTRCRSTCATSCSRHSRRARSTTMRGQRENPAPGAGNTLTMLQFRHMGGALARATPAAGARATLPGEVLMMALGARPGGGRLPRGPRRVWTRCEAAVRPAPGRALPELRSRRPADASGFFDAETWARLRAVKTHTTRTTCSPATTTSRRPTKDGPPVSHERRTFAMSATTPQQVLDAIVDGDQHRATSTPLRCPSTRRRRRSRPSPGASPTAGRASARRWPALASSIRGELDLEVTRAPGGGRSRPRDRRLVARRHGSRTASRSGSPPATPKSCVARPTAAGASRDPTAPGERTDSRAQGCPPTLANAVHAVARGLSPRRARPPAARMPFSKRHPGEAPEPRATEVEPKPRGLADAWCRLNQGALPSAARSNVPAEDRISSTASSLDSRPMSVSHTRGSGPSVARIARARRWTLGPPIRALSGSSASSIQPSARPRRRKSESRSAGDSSERRNAVRNSGSLSSRVSPIRLVTRSSRAAGSSGAGSGAARPSSSGTAPTSSARRLGK